MRNRFHLAAWASALVGVLLGLGGCNKGPSFSELEQRERNSQLYTRAMDDLQAGRVDAAIKGFERVVLQEPNSYSAHFQLATLLQDVRKDYISAIAHYRDYLALRPASEKATVAQDRVKLCETLLTAEIVRKAGGSASNKLAADNESLTKERDALSAKSRKLEAELAKAKKDIARLEAENESKRKMLAKLSSAEGASARSKSVKEALAMLKKDEEIIERRRLNPTDADLLDEEDTPSSVDLRGAKAQYADSDAGATGASGSIDASSLAAARALGEDAERTPAQPAAGATQPTAKKTADVVSMLGARKAKPTPGGGTRPDTYVVQQGDTLSQISIRFYGSRNMWQSIQNVNRATIPMDGRLRAGQTIKLP